MLPEATEASRRFRARAEPHGVALSSLRSVLAVAVLPILAAFVNRICRPRRVGLAHGPGREPYLGRRHAWVAGAAAALMISSPRRPHRRAPLWAGLAVAALLLVVDDLVTAFQGGESEAAKLMDFIFGVGTAAQVVRTTVMRRGEWVVAPWSAPSPWPPHRHGADGRPGHAWGRRSFGPLRPRCPRVRRDSCYHGLSARAPPLVICGHPDDGARAAQGSRTINDRRTTTNTALSPRRTVTRPAGRGAAGVARIPLEAGAARAQHPQDVVMPLLRNTRPPTAARASPSTWWSARLRGHR